MEFRLIIIKNGSLRFVDTSPQPFGLSYRAPPELTPSPQPLSPSSNYNHNSTPSPYNMASAVTPTNGQQQLMSPNHPQQQQQQQQYGATDLGSNYNPFAQQVLAQQQQHQQQQQQQIQNGFASDDNSSSCSTTPGSIREAVQNLLLQPRNGFQILDDRMRLFIDIIDSQDRLSQVGLMVLIEYYSFLAFPIRNKVVLTSL